MTTKYLIQSTEIKGKEVPAQDFGYTAIQVVDYYDWLYPNEHMYNFEYVCSPTLFKQKPEWLLTDANTFPYCVPIGSVEFVLSWFAAMGIENVKPLNIPKELWHFCDRKIAIGKLKDFTGTYMIKDINNIKYEYNQRVTIYPTMLYGDKYHYSLHCREFFLSEWVDNVESEWRVFVFNGEIQDIRCYSGDPWKTPDKQYVQEVVDTYSQIRNTAYTLDIMVTDKKTEILELHDFFSCGLYGFEDFRVLPLMWRRSANFILGERKNGS